MKRLAPVLMVLGALASLATSRGHSIVFDTGGIGREDTASCDEQQALCVTTTVDGAETAVESIQVQDADKVLVADLSCTSATCCLQELDAGSYVLVAEHAGQTVAQPFVMADWGDCVLETQAVDIAFEEQP